MQSNYVDKWAEGALEATRLCVGAGLKSFEFAQEQAKKNVDLTMASAGQMQEQARNIYSEWQKTADLSRRSYTDFIENGLEILSKTLNGHGKEIHPKPEKGGK